MTTQVPHNELENRSLSGVVQTYRGGRRKSVCWFNRNIIMGDVMYGIAVSQPRTIVSRTLIIFNISNIFSSRL